MSNPSIKTLQEKAKYVRRELFNFTTNTGIGHLHSSLSCVDILVSLYYDNATLFNPDKDEFIFSKGHGSPAIYPLLVDLGYVDKSELDNYCKRNGMFRLHADPSIPHCDFVGGSLGNGIGYAAGRGFTKEKTLYVLLGDGELYEGVVWETLIFISHHNLCNVRLIVDRNELCILGATEELLKLEPLQKKFEGFGFKVHDIDGHDFNALRKVFSTPATQPEVIIANTIKGKGVSYMEGVWQYHTVVPRDPELIKRGKKELA